MQSIIITSRLSSTKSTAYTLLCKLKIILRLFALILQQCHDTKDYQKIKKCRMKRRQNEENPSWGFISAVKLIKPRFISEQVRWKARPQREMTTQQRQLMILSFLSTQLIAFYVMHARRMTMDIDSKMLDGSISNYLAAIWHIVKRGIDDPSPLNNLLKNSLIIDFLCFLKKVNAIIFVQINELLSRDDFSPKVNTSLVAGCLAPRCVSDSLISFKIEFEENQILGHSTAYIVHPIVVKASALIIQSLQESKYKTEDPQTHYINIYNIQLLYYLILVFLSAQSRQIMHCVPSRISLKKSYVVVFWAIRHNYFRAVDYNGVQLVANIFLLKFINSYV